MKILLIQPNYDSHIIHPPLGLGYIASTLRKAGYEISIYDGTRHNALEEDFIEAIETSHPDLIGISLFCRGQNKVRKLVSRIKKRFDIPIVIGGPQASALSDYILENFETDFVIIGEGEVVIKKLAEEIETGKKRYDKIEGLGYKDGIRRQINKRAPLIEDLDSLPFPAWDLMPPEKYRIVPILSPAKGFPIAPIITSRGCPYECTFCATNVTWERKLRTRSPANVIKEIKYLIKDFGVKEIHFCDDNITFYRKFIDEICELILQERIKIPWQCPNGVRIDTLDKKLLYKMKEAGCYSIGLGIESGNQNILNKIKKRLDLQKTEQVLKNIKDVGMRLYGFFILGLPGETEKTIWDTIRFAKENPFDRVWFCILAPYPGSEIFNELLKKKNISLVEFPWDMLDTNTALSEIEGLDCESLERYQKIAVKKFYLRPKIFIDIATNMGWKEFVTLIKSRFFKKMIGRKQ